MVILLEASTNSPTPHNRRLLEAQVPPRSHSRETLRGPYGSLHLPTLRPVSLSLTTPSTDLKAHYISQGKRQSLTTARQSQPPPAPLPHHLTADNPSRLPLPPDIPGNNDSDSNTASDSDDAHHPHASSASDVRSTRSQPMPVRAAVQPPKPPSLSATGAEYVDHPTYVVHSATAAGDEVEIGADGRGGNGNGGKVGKGELFIKIPSSQGGEGNVISGDGRRRSGSAGRGRPGFQQPRVEEDSDGAPW